MVKRPRNMTRRQLYRWLLDNSIKVPSPEYANGPCRICHLKPEGRGYVHVRHEGIKHGAHRFIYETFHKRSPEVVRHTCDTRTCISPRHLRGGTTADNVQDRQGRNRQAKGTKQGLAKLTDFQVRRIRDEYAKGGVSHKELGRRYGVSASAIGKVLAGDTWRHISETS